MNTEQLGAHEVLELHEVLTCAINSINQFHIYETLVTDESLLEILHHQLNFMINEYNQLIQLTQKPETMTEGKSTYKVFSEFVPRYGLDNPMQVYPKPSIQNMTDQDLAQGMLSIHKSSAVVKMTASLEISNKNLRDTIIQSAKNCSDQAYELFEYMNRRGFYQVPTLVNQNDLLAKYIEAPNEDQLRNGFQ
ncbi:spore coat protein [Bacillus sp. 31A1R]|uniref:Spore coat protein n=1 Tax=Robertmurraya mangrovi TaxID=3098077 RepID=A0ABU5IWU0_9BACI|nr:spore coat protein [Bacillus sp. 31A1R]MDZ5471614.1 spore coat protein [Bacillus sp. 31A1R]